MCHFLHTYVKFLAQHIRLYTIWSLLVLCPLPFLLFLTVLKFTLCTSLWGLGICVPLPRMLIA